MRISASGRSYTLHIGDLGPNDDLVARRETGLPVTPFFAEERFGMDSLLVMLWTARRKNGEPKLRFDQVLAEYPTYESITAANFQVEALEEQSPTEEQLTDPLSSGAG